MVIVGAAYAASRSAARRRERIAKDNQSAVLKDRSQGISIHARNERSGEEMINRQIRTNLKNCVKEIFRIL
jgi:hypothetical protein